MGKFIKNLRGKSFGQIRASLKNVKDDSSTLIRTPQQLRYQKHTYLDSFNNVISTMESLSPYEAVEYEYGANEYGLHIIPSEIIYYSGETVEYYEENYVDQYTNDNCGHYQPIIYGSIVYAYMGSKDDAVGLENGLYIEEAQVYEEAYETDYEYEDGYYVERNITENYTVYTHDYDNDWGSEPYIGSISCGNGTNFLPAVYSLNCNYLYKITIENIGETNYNGYISDKTRDGAGTGGFELSIGHKVEHTGYYSYYGFGDAENVTLKVTVEMVDDPNNNMSAIISNGVVESFVMNGQFPSAIYDAERITGTETVYHVNGMVTGKHKGQRSATFHRQRARIIDRIRVRRGKRTGAQVTKRF